MTSIKSKKKKYHHKNTKLKFKYLGLKFKYGIHILGLKFKCLYKIFRIKNGSEKI